MQELVFEILLRLPKAIAAVAIGLLVWVVAVGPLASPATVELALLAWLSGAALILLVQESPI